MFQTTADRPMIFRRQLRLAAVALMQSIPNVTVQSPGDLNTPPEKMPAILVRTTGDNRRSKAPGVAQFDNTAMLVLEPRVQAETAEAAQDAIEALCYLIENKIFKGYWMSRIVQEFSTVQTEQEILADGGKHIAGARMAIGCTGFELFDATIDDPVDAAWPPAEPAIITLDRIRLHLDAAVPFDPNGTYTGSLFPDSVKPAPRTSGPDGRDEGALDVDLTT